MKAYIEYGTRLYRVWPDGSNELLAWFTYREHAQEILPFIDQDYPADVKWMLIDIGASDLVSFYTRPPKESKS